MNAVSGSEASDQVHQQLVATLGCDATFNGFYAALGRDVELHLVSGWARRGAETYSLFFDAATSSGVSRYVLKVCVAGYGGHSRTVDRWMERRSVIAESGVKVPSLLAWSGVAFCEEHISHTLGEALRRPDADVSSLIRDLAITLLTIQGLGFNPSRLDDLRSRGIDVVVVDFGADLTLGWDRNLARMIRQHVGCDLSRGNMMELLEILSACIRLGEPPAGTLSLQGKQRVCPAQAAEEPPAVDNPLAYGLYPTQT